MTNAYLTNLAIILKMINYVYTSILFYLLILFHTHMKNVFFYIKAEHQTELLKELFVQGIDYLVQIYYQLSYNYWYFFLKDAFALKKRLN